MNSPTGGADTGRIIHLVFCRLQHEQVSRVTGPFSRIFDGEMKQAGPGGNFWLALPSQVAASLALLTEYNHNLRWMR